MSKKKRNKKFKKILGIYIIFLFILSILCLVYVDYSLLEYEKGDIDNYLKSLIKDMKASARMGNIDKYITLPDIQSDYEKEANFNKGYAEIFGSKNITYKLISENNYDITLNDQNICSVTLDGSHKKQRLLLLNYTAWEVESIKCDNENGLYNYKIYISDDYTLKINNNKVDTNSATKSTVINGYEEVSEKVILPKLNEYDITNLTYEPTIEIFDTNNKKVDFTNENNEIYIDSYFHTDSLEKTMEKLEHKDFDPIKVAETYSLFLTAYNDTSGFFVSFNDLSKYLLEGTNVYKNAYSWATGVDTTFTSLHTLDKERFTNEKLSNFTVYNQNAFSVEVYLEKNMTLSSGLKVKDTLHDMYYFAYIDDGYKLVNIKTVTED